MNAVGKGWRVLALAALVAGCDGGGTTPSVATTVTAASATSQTAVTGLSVAQAPAVQVLDQRGEPMAGVPVTFAASSGSGTLASPAATTDAAGVASAAGWKLGMEAGTQTATARVGDLPLVTFTATAQARAATTVVSASPSPQTAVAGSPVAQAPAVRVTDQAGDPFPGAQVTFAVTAGAGEITPATATTNAAGVASAETWTLGTEGQNTVTATLTGAAPVQFSATAQARVATTLLPVTPTAQIGFVSMPVSLRPLVQVRDQAGQGMPGVVVTFAVTEGGGTLPTTTVTSGLGGWASADSWTLGPVPGRNVLRVTAAGLAPVEFEATAHVRAATTIQAVSPTSQSAPVSTAVAQRPSVRVNDQAGEPMAGVQVTFFVTSGAGSVTGATATTSAAGVATVGSWTLGPVAGQNTLTASIGALPPVTFTATGTAGDPCTTSVRYTLGSTVNGSLATSDCRLSTGEYLDFYDTTLPTAQGVSFNMSSTAVNSFVELYDAAGNLVGFNDNASDGNNNAALRVFAPSGSYFIGATSQAAGQTGAYQLSSSGLTGNNNCAMYWVVPGVTIPGTVATTDCNFDGYLSDVYLVILRPGQTLTMRMQSTAVNAYLGLYDINGDLVDDDDNSGGGNNALLTYTYTGTTVTAFFIDAGTLSRGETGSYTLTVTSN